MDRFIDARGGHCGIRRLAQSPDPCRQQILQEGADDIEGQIKDTAHDRYKYRNGRIFTGQDPVDPLAAQMFPALVRLHNTGLADLLDKGKPHVRHGRAPVQSALLFHLEDDMLQHFQFILVQSQLIDDQMVSLDRLVCRETGRKPCPLRMVLDQVDDCVETAVDSAAVVVGVTEILSRRPFLIVSDMDGVADQLIDSFIFCGHDRNHRNSQHTLHPVDIDRPAVAAQLVHHIEGDHDRNIHFQQLHGQIQVSLNIRGIHDIDDRPRVVVKDKVPAHQLLARIGRHGINTRQVSDHSISLTADLSVLAVHRDPREVPDMLICPGQLVKKRRLAAVLVSDKGKGQELPVRERISASLGMILALFSKAGVLDLPGCTFLLPVLRCSGTPCLPSCFILNQCSLDLPGILQPQSQLISMDAQFHRIPHGSQFHQGHLRPGDHSHVQEMLAQRALSSNCIDSGCLPDFQVSDRHAPAPFNSYDSISGLYTDIFQ